MNTLPPTLEQLRAAIEALARDNPQVHFLSPAEAAKLAPVLKACGDWKRAGYPGTKKETP